MATEKRTPKTRATDLERLPQGAVSWLIGKPVSWVREHTHLFSRDNDGTYDARAVVAGMMRSQVNAADLTDGNLESALRLAEYSASASKRRDAAPFEF